MSSGRDTGGVPGRRRSPLASIGAFVALFVVGVGARVAGVPLAPIVLVVSGVGAVLLMTALGDRKFDRVEQLEPGALDQYPVQLPVQRWAVGSPWQLRSLPSSRPWWAPGVLGVGYDAARFVPSSAARSHLAWSGRPTSVEVIKVLQAACVVRFHTPDGAAQFSVQLPARQVRGHLQPLLSVVGERP